jgi:hypothetical protein
MFNQLLKSTTGQSIPIVHTHTVITENTHQRQNSGSSGDGVVGRAVHRERVTPMTSEGLQGGSFMVNRRVLKKKGVLGHIDPTSGRFIAKNKKIAKKYSTKRATKSTFKAPASQKRFKNISSKVNSGAKKRRRRKSRKSQKRVILGHIDPEHP